MKLFSFLLFTCLASTAMAQKKVPKNTDDVYAPADSIHYSRWSPGHLVTTKGDTVYGRLNTAISANFWLYDPEFIKLHRDGMRDVRFKADRVRLYEFQDTTGAWVRYESFPVGWSQDYNFLRLAVNGKCKVYMMPVVNSGAAAIGGVIGAAIAGPDTAYYIQKGGSSLWRIQQLHFKKDMMEFFQYCPLIISALQGGTYTIDNWQWMITDFNKSGCR